MKRKNKEDKLRVTLHKMASKSRIGDIPKPKVVQSKKYKKAKYKEDYEAVPS